MKLRKLFSLLLSLCIIAGAVNIPLTASAADTPSYIVKGEVSGGQLVAQVYVSGALAYGGRLAIAYDKNVLALSNTSSLTKAVKQASGVTVTAEGHADSVLLGDGHVMFAWYATRTAGLNARTADKKLVTITFNLVNGATENDFSRNTLGLYYVNETMVDGWDSSAKLIANVDGRLAAYKNTAANEANVCGVEFDYPNCDYIPIKTYNLSVNARNMDSEPIQATVMVDNIESNTDLNGHVDYLMPSGTYVYRVTSPGYEARSGYFIITDSDETFNVKLRSYAQIAEDIAKNLKIGYAEGDNASSVTADLIFPTYSDYGTITWSSSSSAVSEYGVVRRGEDDTTVTLTATVDVNGAIAARNFDVVVKSRLTAKEKNMAAVSQDKSALEIGYAPGDDNEHVTVGLTLSEIGANGSSISWESGDDSIISHTGAVTRPENDTEVTMTAYITRGTERDTKTFTVTVLGTGKPAPAPTEEPQEADEEDEMPDIEPTPQIINEPEEPEEPGYEDEMPDIEPTPQVINEPADVSNEIVQRIINALEIGYAKGDSAENVTEKLTLPSVGAEDTVITWTSSLPAVITPYGGVVRQAEDAKVTLTATVTRGDASADKVFIVTVKAADTIPENPSNGQEEEIEELNLRRRRRTTTEQSQSANSEGVGSGQQEAPTTEPAPTPTAAPTPNKTENKKFNDIDTVPWAQNAINALTERGVINGTSDGTYSPNNNIRRADFVMLLVKLLEIDADITDTFDDVTEGNYYYSDVSKAKSLGVISGVDATHFNPEGSISRQDMMTMTYRALQKLGKADDMTGAELSTFNDADSISDYALESIKHLVGGGYIHGDNSGYLNPLSNTTRAETAVFLYGLAQ